MSDKPGTEKSGDGDGRRSGWASARLRTEFWCRSGNGSGVIQSISSSGAVVAKPSLPLIIGDDVRLRFSLLEDTLPIEIRAAVSEETNTGYEVEFLGLSPRTRKLLRMAIAKAVSRADESSDPDDTPTLLSLGEN